MPVSPHTHRHIRTVGISRGCQNQHRYDPFTDPIASHTNRSRALQVDQAPVSLHTAATIPTHLHTQCMHHLTGALLPRLSRGHIQQPLVRIPVDASLRPKQTVICGPPPPVHFHWRHGFASRKGRHGNGGPGRPRHLAAALRLPQPLRAAGHRQVPAAVPHLLPRCVLSRPLPLARAELHRPPGPKVRPGDVGRHLWHITVPGCWEDVCIAEHGHLGE